MIIFIKKGPFLEKYSCFNSKCDKSMKKILTMIFFIDLSERLHFLSVLGRDLHIEI